MTRKFARSLSAGVLSILLFSTLSYGRQVVTTEEEREQRAAEMKRYRGVVDSYASGDSAAVKNILGWDTKRLEAIVTVIGTSHDPSRSWTPDALRAATMLHTDAAMDRLYEDERRVGFELHVASRLLQKGGPALHAFSRQWYSIVSRTLRSAALFSVDERFLESGRKLQPHDATLLYESGLLQEHLSTFAAFLTPVEIPAGPPPRPGGALQSQGEFGARRGPQPAADYRRALNNAAEWFRASLAVDGSSELARLHLGRVQILRGNREGAELLERLTASGDPATAYLATMFLAGMHARDERPELVAKWYRAAIAWLPSAQSPYIGLSETLQKLGRGDEARDVLRTWLDRPSTASADPWWLYLSDSPDELRRQLAALRATVRR
jgi:tetratricopeptide (TPR) repeat protein